MDLNIQKIFTEVNVLEGFVEEGLPEMVDSLGAISYQGKFAGTISEFELKGILQTQLGLLESDIFMDFNEDYSSANYKGAIRLNAFQLGKLLNDSLQVGEVSLNAEIEGDGFALDSMNANLKLQIENLEYVNYEYKDIFVDGLLDKGVFIGSLDLKDPNATVDFDGKISFNDAKPIYQFTMLVDTLNLQQLNLMEDQLSFHAKLDMNFSGQQLNDFDGEMNVSELFINNNGETFRSDTLEVKSVRQASNNRILTITSSFLAGEIKGDYDFDELYDLALAYVNEYFPLDQIVSTSQQQIDFKSVKKPQDLDLNFVLKDATPITFFVPQLTAMNGAQLTGNFNSTEKTLAIDLGIQKIRYDDFSIESINFNSDGNATALTNQLIVNELASTSGINIPQIKLDNRLLDNSMYFDLVVGNDTINQVLDIAATITDAQEG